MNGIESIWTDADANFRQVRPSFAQIFKHAMRRNGSMRLFKDRQPIGSYNLIDPGNVFDITACRIGLPGKENLNGDESPEARSRGIPRIAISHAAGRIILRPDEQPNFSPELEHGLAL